MKDIKRKIIIDTDNGDDIDDLFAIYFALLRKDIDVIGITTVFGNTNLRARQINKVLSLANRKDIPVYAGCGLQMKTLHPRTLDHVYCQYETDLDDEKYTPINESENCSGDGAINFLIDMANKYQEELTIVAIGPLTNIAKAIIKDKEAMQKPKYVTMGGCYNDLQREWNIACDYEAAHIFYSNKLNITSIGVDVTMNVKVTDKIQNILLNLRHEDKFLNYLYDTTRLWYKTYQRNVVMHDPLALYYVCDPSLFETTQYNISVIQEGSLTAALTMPLEKIYRKQISPDSEFYSVTNCAVSANYKKFMRILRKELEF